MYREKKEMNSFKEFTSDLKEGKISNVILMHGVEQYLVKWAVESLVKKLVNPATVSMDYTLLDEENSSIENIIEACNTYSMFSEKRVVWVRDFPPLNKKDYGKGYTKEAEEALFAYFDQANPAAVLIFSSENIEEKSSLVRKLPKVGNVYNFERLKRNELISFASKRFRNSNVTISNYVMRFLIDETGYFNNDSDYRLYNFENDIRKLIAYCEGREIREEDITEIVSGDLETFIFDLLDSMTSNQKDKAFKILHNKLNEYDGEKVNLLVASIISQFEVFFSVKELREDGKNIEEMQKLIGGSPYRIKKLIPYTNRFSIEKLREILSNAYEITYNTRSGMLSDQLALEMFIARI